MARIVLGHGDERTTRVYARRDLTKMIDAIARVG
jgi:hypothetical protein